MAERRWGIDKVTEADIRGGGFSTPWDAPLVPPFPFQFRNAEIITGFYRTEPAAMAFLAPPPVEAVGDVVGIHIYKMNDTDWIGPYHEANVMFGARHSARWHRGCLFALPLSPFRWRCGTWEGGSRSAQEIRRSVA